MELKEELKKAAKVVRAARELKKAEVNNDSGTFFSDGWR